MSFSAALLDLDGTLLNTLPDLADATNAMRIELGLHPLSQDIVATYLGKGTRNLVSRALSNSLDAPVDEALLDARWKWFRRAGFPRAGRG